MPENLVQNRNNRMKRKMKRQEKNSAGDFPGIEELYSNVIDWFKDNVPEPRTELHYDTPFHLLIAVILSAQCTDKRVNIYTPAIFKAFPEPADLAAASFDEVFGMIKSITFPNNKARHLIGMADMLVKDFGSIVPDDPDLLVRLPGVGQKTANVIASVIYDKPVIAVDTHVFRVSRRLGLSSGKTVEAVEKDLTERIPAELRATAHHWLILHGRYTCTARKPKCGACGLSELCMEYKTTNFKSTE